MKYAVYVEGQSEMLFVADVLQKYSNYDPAKVGFKCINLTADIYEARKLSGSGRFEFRQLLSNCQCQQRQSCCQQAEEKTFRDW